MMRGVNILEVDIVWIVVLAWTLGILLCPWTKVEESFNVQAMHDVLYHRFNISEYDHLDFPGVVPRTCFGAAAVSTLTGITPFWNGLRMIGISKMYSLYAARLVISMMVFWAFRSFAKAVEEQFGRSVMIWFSLVTVSQFHLNFYASRPLPNTFALALTLRVFADILQSRFTSAVWLATVAVLIFRSELVLLFAPIFLLIFYRGHMKLTNAVKHGIFAAIIALGLTVPLDSFFWRRLVWPEGEVWWYNVVENKSKNWGTSPFLWYFYSALPRGLLLSLPLALLSAYWEKKPRYLVLPSLLFLALYSFLPHKELRFIIYVFPLFNVATATICHRWWINRNKNRWRKLLGLIAVGHLIVNFLGTLVFISASRANYPGADAMLKLQQLADSDRPLRIHIDVYAAQRGVSRFLHLNSNWEYNKTENLDPMGAEISAFDYLLVGSDDLSKEMDIYASRFASVYRAREFRGIRVPELSLDWPFVHSSPLHSKETVAILKKKGPKPMTSSRKS